MASRNRKTTKTTTTTTPIARSNSPASSDGNDDDDDEEMLLQALDSGGSRLSPDTTRRIPREVSPLSTRQQSIPVGAWRDGLWDIARHGGCHGSLWTACCCIPLAIGQVMNRLQLHVFGEGGGVSTTTTKQHASVTMYTTLVLAVVSYWVTRILMFLLIALFDPNADDDVKEWIEPGPIYYTLCAVDDVLSLAYMAASIWMLRRVRQQVRRMYAIPDKYCSYEDTCCSLVCPCFVAGQLLRHTADYEQYPSRFCCTATGLSANAPSIV